MKAYAWYQKDSLGHEHGPRLYVADDKAQRTLGEYDRIEEGFFVINEQFDALLMEMVEIAIDLVKPDLGERSMELAKPTCLEELKRRMKELEE